MKAKHSYSPELQILTLIIDIVECQTQDTKTLLENKQLS